jgi:hypothetical protein
LRRRRRHSTQVFKKKDSTSQKSPYQRSISKSDARWKRWLVFLFFVFILAAASYYLYTLGYDSIPIEPIESPSDTADAAPIEQQDEQVEIISIPPLEENIQIEILNGCGINGIAKIFQSYLREQGFDVVNTDNYLVGGKRHWDLKESKIIDHMGHTEQAEALARSLGISLDKIEVKESETAIYDMSVVIGKDYKKLKGFQ